jgi:hypothetical protein
MLFPARLRRIATWCAISLLGLHCAPPGYVPESLDLSGVRIGQHRTKIEAALRIRSESALRGDRVVVLYDYGPGTEGARRAGEASAYCLPHPSVGGGLACSMNRALYGALAESAVADLQGSVLQVAYNADGYAEWVVFGSTVDELERANEMIDGAERGEAEAALLVGRSLSQGSSGFPIDSLNGYKWLGVAAIWGAPEAGDERDRVRGRLSPENRKAVDREVRDWAPRRRH